MNFDPQPAGQEFAMNTRISLTHAAFGLIALVALAGCAQAPVDHSAHQVAGAPGMGMGAGMGDHMARMDTHMKAMREMHEKMARARTPEERQALMDEHRKLMREGMAMMGGMQGMGMGAGPGPGSGPGAGAGAGPGPGGGMGAGMKGMGGHHQMMEKRMQMMHSMMQMMMDRMETPTPRP